MSKPKNERRLPDDSAMAMATSLRTGARKLNLVAATVRGMGVESALTQLTFSKRRISQDVKKVLQSAIANAENNHGLDVDKLYVSEAWVGRSFVMKRFRARGRGKSASIEKPFSKLTVVVRERQEGDKPLKVKRSPAKAEEAVASKAPAKKAPAKKVTAKTTAKATTKTTSKGTAKKAAAEA